MSRKATPDQVAQCVAMRAAGYTVALIARETDLSASTIKRICRRHKAGKGEATEELINAARDELIGKIAGDESLRAIAAALVQDTLVQLEACREAMANASTHLKASNTDEALKVMRACASWSNALKLTADATRSALKIDPRTGDATELPVLTVSVLSDADAEAERERQDQEAIDLGLVRADP